MQNIDTSNDLYKALQRAISNITFQGHRVNDTYSTNKRKDILNVVMYTIQSTTPPPNNDLAPALTVLIKLGSLAVHIEELLSPYGHSFDRSAIESLLTDPELKEWLVKMDKLAFLPKKRF